ncbi:MAG: DUF1926 domain-containing protein [Acidobacteriia bacterium]|nr:DUF1926 domain-containing protein [Terriglobia bacterium]
MNKIYLALIIHAHQPVGNFNSVFERAYRKSYLPFLQCLEQHPQIRLSMHFSGGLLEWLDHHQPEYFQRLNTLIQRNQMELLGGGFFEPILPMISQHDAQAQMARMKDYLKNRFGVAPRGFWLAERVWEPQLPTTLAKGGFQYVCVDDSHFLAAGLSPDDLHGYYLTENLGDSIAVIPGSKRLRYIIPFREPAETIDYLRAVASQGPNRLIAMADDLEKFGLWPHTFEHVYQNRWLERFFKTLEQNHDWIEVLPAAEYLSTHRPLDRVYLPTTSYDEMMEWVLPSERQKDFEQAKEIAQRSPQGAVVRAFLRGGFFRNFLARYPEANLLHKRMLRTSDRLLDLERRASRAGNESRVLWNLAHDHLLRAQANDAYWHGVFGGLYAPHLRHSAQRNLSLADSFADEMELSLSGQTSQGMECTDFECNSTTQIHISTPPFSALLAPQDGATLAYLDFKPCALDVINSIARRPESYHDRVPEELSPDTAPAASVQTIHERTAAKEAHLRQWLVYDSFLRHSFRLLVFHPAKAFEDFRRNELQADPEIAAGEYRWNASSRAAKNQTAGSGDIRPRWLTSSELKFGLETPQWSVQKDFHIGLPQPEVPEIACDFKLSRGDKTAETAAVGVEMVFNLMAPDEPDRYLEAQGTRYPLDWQGSLGPCDSLVLVDEYQEVRIEIRAASPCTWWITPLQTVTQSEEGFEAVYQGSSILPHWICSSSEPFQSKVTLRVSRLFENKPHAQTPPS